MPDKILNSKKVTGPLTYVVRDNDDILNVDTTLGVVTLVFANIRGSGFNFIQKQYYVNDIGNQASVNNIILQATNGDRVNNLASFPLTTNGASVQLLISSQTEWLATGDISNGGSPILADNGLTMSGSTILFGGNLIVPTTLNALGSNTFSINDQAGLFMQTRDAQGNFFFNNIGGTGTLIGSSNYVFSYLGDGGNVFENTFIVINFGGANYIKGGTDFWNFGDYTIAEDNYSVFNFGRFNEYYNSQTIFTNGFSNTFNSVNNTSVYGVNNILTNLSYSSVIGNDNFLEGQVNYILGQSNLINSNSTYIVGRNVFIDQPNPTGDIYALGWGLNVIGGNFVDAIVSVGFVNTINAQSSTRGVYLFGDSLYCDDFVTYSTMIGESSLMTRADHTFAFGIFNSYTDVTYVYSVGEQINVANTTNSLILGLFNDIVGNDALSLIGQNNITSNLQNSTLIGINNLATDTSYLNLVGSNNVIDNSTNSTIIGLSNQLTLSNDTTLIGLGNTITANANSVLIGFGNYGIKLDDSVLDIGLFGGTPLVSFNYSVTPSIVVNVPTSPVGLPSKALWDNVGVINITP